MSERLSFSRSLYRADAIAATIQAYAGLATLSVDDTSDHELVVTVTDPHPSQAGELVDAMCNHILFTTLRRQRVDQGGTL